MRILIYFDISICHTSNEQYSKQEIREKRCKVDNFSRPAHSLPYAEVAENPDQKKSASQLPTNVSNMFYTTRNL